MNPGALKTEEGIFKMPQAPPKRGITRRVTQRRESSIASSTTTTTTTNDAFTTSGVLGLVSFPSTNEDGMVNQTTARAKQKFGTDNPFSKIHPHRTQVVPKVTFAARQCAWSVGGEWMVVVGDQGMLAIFSR